MDNTPIISKGELRFCAGVNIDPYIEKAKRIANKLYEMFKDDKDMIIETNFCFQNSTLINCNFGHDPNKVFPKFVFYIITKSNMKDNSGDFVIEVNIILEKLTCYKFDMRWKE